MYAPLILRIDLREDPPAIEELKEHIPDYKRVAIRPKQADYRIHCMDGMEHPLRIECEDYTLVTVAVREIDTTAREQSGAWSRYATFNEEEMRFIVTVQEQPEVEWAVDNSFDGLYVVKEDNFATFRTHFKFGVYMKKEQATFWKLKFSGR